MSPISPILLTYNVWAEERLSWATRSLLITLTHRQYSAISHLHHIEFTVAYTLGFCVFASRLLPMDLNTETTTLTLQILHINQAFTSHVNSSQADLLFSSVLLVPIRCLVCVLLPQLLFTHKCPELKLSLHSLLLFWNQSQSQSYVTTDGHSPSLSWCQAPIWGLRQDLYYFQTVVVFYVGALSDERTCLPFTVAAGPRQCSHSWVRVPRNS
jgi:hypothetical protein